MSPPLLVRIGDEARAIARRGIAAVTRDLPIGGEDRPVFVIGCGRSGTTILGRCISMLPGIAYLNERWETWNAAYPCGDVWSRRASARRGRMKLDAEDATTTGRRRLAAQFRFTRLVRRAAVFVIKLPVNNFRVGFLDANFPNARYVFIHRQGLEVARSIARLADRNAWFGHDDYKWKPLVELAEGDPATRGIPDRCRSNLDRGLLEWRLSTEHAVAGLGALPIERRFALSYDQLVDRPDDTMARVANFLLGDAAAASSVDYGDILGRRSEPLSEGDVSTDLLDIGGPRLLDRGIPPELRGDDR